MAGSVIATQTSRPRIAEDPVARAAVSASVLHGDGRPGSGGQALALCGCFGSLAPPGALVLSLWGAAEERRPCGPQREPPPGARRSTRRPVCGREHCQRTCRAAVGLRRCVVRPLCWPCSPSGPRPDRSGRRCRQPASRTRPLVSCCVPSLRALPLDEACELRIRPGRWRSLAPGKESVAKRSLACLQPCCSSASSAASRRLRGKRLTFQAVVASASLARIRCFVMANCGRLRLGPECWSSVRTLRSSRLGVRAARSVPAAWMSGGW